MEPFHPPSSPETEYLYSARHRPQLCYHHQSNYPSPLHYTMNDHCTTAVEVHEYPSSESGIAADCSRNSFDKSSRRTRHRRRNDHNNLSGNEEDDEDDEDDLSLGERCARDLDEILPARLKSVNLKDCDQRQPPVNWNRSMIAATMERYDPPPYCYAYHSPDLGTRHDYPKPGSSKRSDRHKVPNRLIFNPKQTNTKHAYVTRYGTEENIYEEITEGSRSRCPRHRCQQRRRSVVSLDRSVVEEEVRRVESRHKRILGELNLSVEAMLMPESSDSETGENNDDVDKLSRVEPTDELLSPASCNPLDVDSGFSGSSSGASYVGSLRCKEGSTIRSNTHKSVAYGSQGVKILTNDSHLVRNTTDTVSTSNYGVGMKSSGFWTRKSWKKSPSLTSSGSLNKFGLSGLLVKYTLNRKTTSPPAASPVGNKRPTEALNCETCLSQRC